VVFLSVSEYVQVFYCLFIHICIAVGNPIIILDQINPPHSCVCHRQKPAFQSANDMVFLRSVSSDEKYLCVLLILIELLTITV
jgi:hypothetical protein